MIVHLVYHTHWDREWYLPFSETLQGLRDLVIYLEKESLKFLLDGQIIPLLDLDPPYREKLISMIKEGKVYTGPWLILPDEFLADLSLGRGEVLLRTLLIARKIARDMEVPLMKVGYLPDPFGHSSQIPQLLKAFGIDVAVLWRGVGLEPEKLRTEMRWVGADGSEVLLIYLPDSYGNGAKVFTGKHTRLLSPEVRERGYSGVPKYSFLKPQEMLERIKEALENLEPFLTTQHALLMVGGDHTYPLRPPENLLKELRELASEEGIELRESTLPDYVGSVKKEINHETLPVLKGELRSSRYAPILPNVLSTRVTLKKLNALTLEKLLWKVEPLTALLYLLGGDVPEEILRTLDDVWLLLMRNLPHDDITGCGVDELYLGDGGVIQRYYLIVAKLSTLEEKLRDRLTSHLVKLYPEKEKTELEKRRVLLHLYPKPLRISEVLPEGEQGISLFSSSSYIILSNDYLELKVSFKGEVVLRNLSTGQLITDLLRFEDGGDIGDEYNYSPPPEDEIITSPPFHNIHVEPWEVEDRVLGKRPAIRVRGYMIVPSSADKDFRARSTLRSSLPLEVILWLRDEVLMMRITLVNRAEDHRLRLILRTGMRGEGIYTDAPFDVIYRSIKLERPIPQEVLRRYWKHPYDGLGSELPIATYPLLSFAYLEGAEGGFGVFPKGIAEVEPLKDSDGNLSIALTLLRSVEWLSRRDEKLIYRRDYAAGPEIRTPGAQELGEHTFELGVYLGKSLSREELFDVPIKLWVPPLFLELPLGVLEKLMNPLMNLRGGVLTSMRFSRRGDGEVLIRVFNPEDEEGECSLELPDGFSLDLLSPSEEEVYDGRILVAKDRGRLKGKFSLKPKEIATIRIRRMVPDDLE